jgi:biopolymer transport protein TolR
MADINVTPLVDVMLVLLIIFMITAPMLNNAGVEIDLPKAEAPPLDLDENQLVIGIDAEKNYYILRGEDQRDDQPIYTMAEMRTKLPAIALAYPDMPVFLKADGSIPYREVAELLGVAKEAGMPRIGLVFDPSGLGAPPEDDDDE